MNTLSVFTTLAVSIGDQKESGIIWTRLASSNHLLSLINDILDMGRIEWGKNPLEETEVNLSDLHFMI